MRTLSLSLSIRRLEEAVPSLVLRDLRKSSICPTTCKQDTFWKMLIEEVFQLKVSLKGSILPALKVYPID